MASSSEQNLSNSPQLWHDPVAARTRNGRRGFVAPRPPALYKPARRPSPTLPSAPDDEASAIEEVPPPKRGKTFITLGSEIFSSDVEEENEAGPSDNPNLLSIDAVPFVPKRIRCVTKPTASSENTPFVPKRLRCVTKPTTSNEPAQFRPKRLRVVTKPVASKTNPPTKRLRVFTRPALKPAKVATGSKASKETRPSLNRTTRGGQSWGDKVKTLVDKEIPLSARLTLYSEMIDPKWKYQDWERLPGYKRAGETAAPERQKQLEKIHVELLKEMDVEDENIQARTQINNGVGKNVLGHPSMFTSDRYKYGRSDRITKTQGWIEARVRRG